MAASLAADSARAISPTTQAVGTPEAATPTLGAVTEAYGGGYCEPYQPYPYRSYDYPYCD